MSSATQKIYFNYSRAAITWGCKNLLKLNQGDQILLPQYICRVVPDTLEECGFTVDYYSQSSDLKTNLSSLALKAKTAKAILFIHYFGFSTEFEPIKKIANDNKTFLIEDAAHVVGSKISGRSIGDRVDFSVQSFWKTLPVEQGSLLITNREISNLNLKESEAHFFDLRSLLKGYVVGTTLGRQLTWPKRYKNLTHHNREATTESRLLSADIISKIKSFDLEHESVERRRIDAQWRAWCGRVGLAPLFPAAGGDSPWCTPVLASSREIRDTWLKKLYVSGILGATWPQLTEYSLGIDTCSNIWDRLITLPIEPWNKNLKAKINEL